MEKKVFAYCESNRMLAAGDCVVAGVSGGADSVCLLFLLCAFRESMPLSIKVVHVNHGIRPDAQSDADYVKKLCEKLGVEYCQVDASVREIAKREGISEEEAGRTVRYQAFAECAAAFEREYRAANVEELGAFSRERVKIALAHHMGDRAETLLFHLFRGSGLKGAGSIAPKRETEEGYIVIRPLLCLMREEIESYLSRRGAVFCQDSTNFEDSYARNRIRHHILPYAQEEICHGAVRHLNEFAELAAETERYLQTQTRLLRESCVMQRAADGAAKGSTPILYSLKATEFLKADPLLQKRLILELIKEISPGQKDIGMVHVKAVLELFYGETGRSKALPFGIVARREYDQVILERNAAGEKNGEIREVSLEIPLDAVAMAGSLERRWGDYCFAFEVLPYEKKEIVPEKTYTKWFDYDKIKDTLSIRIRKTGDYLTIRDGEGNQIRKMVKDYMITEKIPRGEREVLPLLVQGQQVLWIPGYRISESYKVDGETKRVLQVTCRLPHR